MDEPSAKIRAEKGWKVWGLGSAAIISQARMGGYHGCSGLVEEGLGEGPDDLAQSLQGDK